MDKEFIKRVIMELSKSFQAMQNSLECKAVFEKTGFDKLFWMTPCQIDPLKCVELMKLLQEDGTYKDASEKTKYGSIPTERRANSAPLSPKKAPPLAEKTCPVVKPSRQGAKSSTSRKIIQSSEDDATDSSDDNEGNAEETSGGEEDPMARYEFQREKIQHERLASPI